MTWELKCAQTKRMRQCARNARQHALACTLCAKLRDHSLTTTDEDARKLENIYIDLILKKIVVLVFT